MIGDSLPTAIGDDLNGSIGTVPGTDSPGATKFNEIAKSIILKLDLIQKNLRFCGLNYVSNASCEFNK